ncbi:MAG: hypothetical protein ACLQGT_02590 [Terracidiphilus sp.]
MCLARRQLDPKSRRIFAAGQLCLFSVVMLAIFVNSFGHGHAVLYFGLQFLLFCCAVGLLRWSEHRSADALPAPERSSYVCA